MLIRLEPSGRWWVMAEATGWLLVHRHEGKDRHLGRYGSLEAARAGAGEHGAPKEALETLDLLTCDMTQAVLEDAPDGKRADPEK